MEIFKEDKSDNPKTILPGIEDNSSTLYLSMLFLTCAVGAEASQQVKADVSLNRHGLGMDLENVRPSLQVWQAKLYLTI